MNRLGVFSVRPQQNGVALVSMLLVLALVTTLCIQMLNQNRLQLKRAATQLRIEQANQLSASGLDYARLLLKRDAIQDLQGEPNGVNDHLAEAWSRPQFPFANQNVKTQLLIEDEQGKFNLNNLINEQGSVDTKQLQVFLRLLASLDLEPELAHNLLDWMDKDQSSRVYNSEDLGYMQLDPPYRAANQRLVLLSELSGVKGFDSTVVKLLSPLVTVLPQQTAVNVNTARVAVLEALMPGLNGEEVHSAVAELDNGFNNLEAFFQHQVSAGLKVPEVSLSVQSQFFRASVRVNYDGYRVGWHSLLRRTVSTEKKSSIISPLWRLRLPYWKLADSGQPKKKVVGEN